MASARYTLNITPDPPEEHHEMTPQEKRANFWYYNKWKIFAGIAAIVLVSFFVYDIVSQVDPDYQIGVISRTTLPDSAVEALETQLATLADDRNGDGKTVVSVMTYTLAPAGSEDNAAQVVDAYTQMAGSTKLMADAQNGESMLFLTNDVQAYELSEALFAYNDGTAPESEASLDLARMGVAWADCPQLTALDLGRVTTMDGTDAGSVQSILADYVLVKRVFAGTSLAEKEKAQSYYAASMQLFDRLTAQ